MDRSLNWQAKLLRLIKQHKKQNVKHVNISVIIIICLMVIFNVLDKYSLASTKKALVNGNSEKEGINIVLVGDIMLGRHVKEVIDKKGYDYLFQNVKPIFQSADYLTGNFEHPVVLKEGYPRFPKKIHLETDKETVPFLQKANFTVLNLANNHMMDYTEPGLRDTLDTFRKTQLDYVGAGEDIYSAKRISYKSIKGIKIATLGFTDSYYKETLVGLDRGGVLPARPDIFLPLVEEAKGNADLVIVHMHWGQEYDTEIHPRQRQLARALVKAGADIIVGSHPHVVEPVEVYKNSVIFYSLGNFIFDQGWSRTRESIVAGYQINEKGVKVKLIPIKILEAQPRVLTRAIDGLSREKIVRQVTKMLNKKDIKVRDESVELILDKRIMGRSN